MSPFAQPVLMLKSTRSHDRVLFDIIQIATFVTAVNFLAIRLFWVAGAHGALKVVKIFLVVCEFVHSPLKS